MKDHQTIINKDFGTVTISQSEYDKLMLYKQYCLEMKDILSGGDGE